jgi:hypothetical protein
MDAVAGPVAPKAAPKHAPVKKAPAKPAAASKGNGHKSKI